MTQNPRFTSDPSSARGDSDIWSIYHSEVDIPTQLRQAVTDGVILWLHWQWFSLEELGSRLLSDYHYPKGAIDCVPLWVGDQLLTVCEIDNHLLFERLIVLRLAAVSEAPLPRHPRSDFFQWALLKHAQKVPGEFPRFDSFEQLLHDAHSHDRPVTLIDSKRRRGASGLLSVTTDEVTFQPIDCCGYFCWPERVLLADLIVVEIGGVHETRLLEHARMSPNCYDPNTDTL